LTLPPGLKEIQWISYPELGFEITFQRLITALDTDLPWVRLLTRFGLRATQWEANGRDDGFLLHGTELREAIRWLEQAATVKSRQPTDVQAQYIRASEEWEVGRIQHLQDLNEEKDRQRRAAAARELVAFSTLSLVDDPERSILLAMHAVNATLGPDQTVIPEAADALHRSILRSPIRGTLRGHLKDVRCVAVGGSIAISGSSDSRLKVWDLLTGLELRTLNGHAYGVSAVAMTPDARIAVSAGDETLKLWEVESGRELLTFQGHTSRVNGVAISGDGRIVVSASSDQTLKVWDVASGRELRTLTGHAHEVSAVAMTPDARIAVSAGDETLKLWEVESGRELLTFQGHTSRVNGVAISGDGRIVVSASNDQALTVWDAVSGRELRTLAGHRGFVYAVAVTPDGQHVASAGSDDTLRVWDLATGRELHTLHGHTGLVLGVALSDNGQVVISASWDWTVRVWEVGSGRELNTLAGHNQHVTGVALSEDGRIAVSASWDQTLKVWEVESGRELRTLRGHSDLVLGVALSGDGRLAVSASHDKTLKVWDVGSGNEVHALSGHTLPVHGMALSGDGRIAVSASRDKTLKVWDVASGRELRTLAGHSDVVYTAALSEDGKTAFSASQDRTLKVWEVESGRELLTLQAHEGAVTAVASGVQGAILLSGGADGIIQVYAMDMELLMLLARNRVTRNLTPEECRKYLNRDDVPPIPTWATPGDEDGADSEKPDEEGQHQQTQPNVRIQNIRSSSPVNEETIDVDKILITDLSHDVQTPQAKPVPSLSFTVSYLNAKANWRAISAIRVFCLNKSRAEPEVFVKYLRASDLDLTVSELNRTASQAGWPSPGTLKALNTINNSEWLGNAVQLIFAKSPTEDSRNKKLESLVDAIEKLTNDVFIDANHAKADLGMVLLGNQIGKIDVLHPRPN
jgi:WD40 repeat protein